MTPAGVRRFGGHSARVSGAQFLAAFGVEVAKIKILARHSTEQIMRYVQEAPLAAIRLDLGLPGSSGPMVGGASRIINKRVNAHDEALIDIDARLGRLERLAPQQPLAQGTMNEEKVVYIQNSSSMAIHQFRTGSACVTICGWNATKQLAAGKALIRHCIDATPSWLVCEKCLPIARKSKFESEDGGDSSLSD